MVVTLIGYRGCGKSTVAVLLARHMNWTSIDADVELERRAGKSIRDIFADDGEPRFRQLERDVLHELLQRDQLVIAAGGGAVLNAETREEMKQSGPVVWLQASVATLETRIQRDAETASRRPSLTSGSPVGEIETVLQQREPIYRQCATHVVSTENLTPDEIAAVIFEQLGESPRTGEPA
ncbi:MAG: shikimate kinase [Planctomycetota bacterium]|nr:shikimate kinase [Planctomycetota bacterium]MDA1212683.1 shikimate kinase [Planctomycetota bacterium]